MKQFLFSLCILFLSGWGQLHAHQNCVHDSDPESTAEHILHTFHVGEETVALHDGYPSSDGEKQVIKMAPTEVTEEDEDDRELISIKQFAAFIFAQGLRNVNECLQFCGHVTRVSASRLHLVFQVFRI
jgi:hypothetical protein